MEPAISIQQLSKKYSRTGDGNSYATLRDTLTSTFKKKGNKNIDFWALKDIDLQINQGDRIGIIGRNGAGKSTLLKIISRITPPTTGQIIMNGRVASLLEVGTGFHPELSGRENIYLNGSILGLKRSEITQRLEEIIDFSGVEAFIDTPLKHYSSGMALRLAFSVAAHLEAEILLVDEVLAVGDHEFQKKCLGKMNEISMHEGRTILFVSHNLEAIDKFCDRSILLDRGHIKKNDSTQNVIKEYLSPENGSSSSTWEHESEVPDANVQLLRVQALNEKGEHSSLFKTSEPVAINFVYRVIKEGIVFTHGINVYNEQGLNIFDSHDNYTEIRKQKREKGTFSATVWIPSNLLPDGNFSIGVALFCQQPFHILIHHLQIINFTVIDDLSGSSARGDYSGYYGGIIRPVLKWQAHITNDVHE